MISLQRTPKVTPYSSVKHKQRYRETEGGGIGGIVKAPRYGIMLDQNMSQLLLYFLQPSPQILLSAVAYSGGYCGRWLLLKRISCHIPFGSLHLKLVLVQFQDYKFGVLAEERS